MTISSEAHFILYVFDQQISTRFYIETLGIQPRLNVPGMTEFDLSDGAVLGLMPYESISRLIGRQINSETEAAPKAEIYLIVDDPHSFHRRALAAGAAELSPMQARDWGHEAAYSIDIDGNVIAFARVVD